MFPEAPAALANSVEIARRCSLRLRLGESRLPLFPVPAGGTPEQYLRDAAGAGLGARRIASAAGTGDGERYRQRLASELDVICSMGFASYFLIVADFIDWARDNGVPVGPGRGSGAGSLVAYALGITDIDPLRYDLLFERFLNPERVSMPDFDIDFCMVGRDRVIDYVRGQVRAASGSRRSSPTARWRPRRWCATSAACSATPTAWSIASPSWCRSNSR